MPPLIPQHQPSATRAETSWLLKQLAQADQWTSVAKVLHAELDLTAVDIGRAAGVTPETAGRWIQAEGDATARNTERLNDLRYLVMVLVGEDIMTLKLLAFWLRARDAKLGVDPLTAISEGRVLEVEAAGKRIGQLVNT